ncbi:MAG: hydroxymethylbilane synthase [Planctomycetota bacterium]
MQIRIGTRGSALARWQADWVADELRRLGRDVELVFISTTGDRQQGSIGELGVQGLFTREIQRALLDGHIDLAVHSLKDLPTEQPNGLGLAAVPPRAAARDALVSPHRTLASLPAGAKVGTSSLRRRAQLLRARPNLTLLDIRGNVDTRLRKLDEGEFDAIVLAEAGLTRLGLAERISERLSLEVMLPAVGQGALGLETRADDTGTIAAVGALDDPATHQSVAAERALLAALEGGCLAPIAAWGRMEGDRLLLTGRVVSVDGRQTAETTVAGDPREAASLGLQAAEELRAAGAEAMIGQARGYRA